eukprot:scaffold21401_cov116-Isochrysis_galbana.AAC.2
MARRRFIRLLGNVLLHVLQRAADRRRLRPPPEHEEDDARRSRRAERVPEHSSPGAPAGGLTLSQTFEC